MNSKQIRQIVSSFSIILLGIGIIFVNAYVTQAASLSELQQQQSEINQQIDENQDKMEETQYQIYSLNDEIGVLDDNIGLTMQKISEVNSQIENTKTDIDNLNKDLENKQHELDEQYQNQDETIRIIYESFKYSSPLRMLMSSSTLSQLINYNAYLEALQDKIENSIAEIEKIKQQMEEDKQALEDKEREQQELAEQQKAYARGLEEQRSLKNEVVNDKEAEVASLEDQIEQSKEMRAQVEAQISAQIAASQSSGASPVDKGVSEVGFMWPANGYITAVFGESTPFQNFHSGLDIANIIGTPIYAASSGTVTTATAMMSGGSYYGYGNYIIIGHNARFSSVYGHLSSMSVSVGQQVERGQIIGYMGSTGWSTGPHLHFEIREYGSCVNPQSYLP